MHFRFETAILYLSDVICYAVPVDALGDADTVGSFLRRLEEAGLRRL
jgi:hypothetical protein